MENDDNKVVDFRGDTVTFTILLWKIKCKFV